MEAIRDGLRSAQAEPSSETVRAALDIEGGAEGDVALPAHRWARALGRPPEEFARDLAARIPLRPPILAAAATGAFVNFRIDPATLARATLDRILVRGSRYGHLDGAGPTTCVEHTSANPTGPLHIGRVRNGIVGDTYARVLRAAGDRVTTQYYVDDLGRQATMLTWIWSKPREAWPAEIAAGAAAPPPEGERDDARLGRPYPLVSAYLKGHPEAAAEVADLVQRIESGHAPPLHRELAEKILAGMVASLQRLGIGFDEFVWESSFVNDGSVERVVERLGRSPHSLREENGARAIDASSHGLPKATANIVYVRANGTNLYITRDLAYHLAKFARFTRVIDVLGQDHRLHARTLEALLEEMGEERRPEFIIYQDLTIPGGGRMSTRSGTGVLLDDLLDEAIHRARAEVRARRPDLSPPEVERVAAAVGTGAIRYHVIRVAPEKPVAFSWEDALSFEGRSGPFVQYAYARASSILEKSGDPIPSAPVAVEPLSGAEERALIGVLARFPRIVREVARSGQVHRIAGYAHDIADQFNRFYHAVPVLNSGGARASRLALVAATRQTLGNALELLGVSPLDTM